MDKEGTTASRFHHVVHVDTSTTACFLCFFYNHCMSFFILAESLVFLTSESEQTVPSFERLVQFFSELPVGR